MRIRHAIAATGILALALASCGGDDAPAEPTSADDEPTPAITVTETETATEEVTETETAVETETDRSGDTGEGAVRPSSDPAQDLIVAPQEALTKTPSDPDDEGGRGLAEFSVGATYGGEELPTALTLGYVPCRSILGSDGPGVQFQGLPDAMGHSDTGEAFPHTIEEERADVAAPWPRRIEGNDDGELTFSFDSEQPDCLASVVFEDVDEDGQLDLDDAGHPIEPYGYGTVTWES